MRITRLRVDGFGPLQGEWAFSPDRVNVILDDNERGKSTVFSAISAALYGRSASPSRAISSAARWPCSTVPAAR